MKRINKHKQKNIKYLKIFYFIISICLIVYNEFNQIKITYIKIIKKITDSVSKLLLISSKS